MLGEGHRERGSLVNEEEGQPGEGSQSVTDSFVLKTDAVRAAELGTRSYCRRLSIQMMVQSLMLEGLPSQRRLGDHHQGSQPGGPSSKLKAPQGWTRELRGLQKATGQCCSISKHS